MPVLEAKLGVVEVAVNTEQVDGLAKRLAKVEAAHQTVVRGGKVLEARLATCEEVIMALAGPGHHPVRAIGPRRRKSTRK